jgi:putative FmdB family regulatory protein
MPLFEYVCSECGMVFTEFRLVAERDSSLECPECHSSNVERKMSAFASLGGVTSGGACVPQGGFS